MGAITLLTATTFPRGLKKRCLFTVWCILLLSLLAACEGEQTNPGAASGSKKPIGQSAGQMSLKVTKLQERLQALLEPIQYKYVPKGKYDIFQPFIKTTIQQSTAPSGPKVCATALECMDVGQLTLVAIVKRADKSYMAMAEDASGVGYPIWLGTKIGYKKGVVTDIKEDRVIIREEGQDVRGRNISVERVLFLHPEGK
ncbi:MAG: pilus assembly protein PilP [Deltaproteobacteria bacterium]|nr:pilus assembly protein PilP [Deltaproteobacteria bacterium]